MVMDVIWRRLCVSMISGREICWKKGMVRECRNRYGRTCSELGKGVTSEVRKYLFRADNVWWRCV